MDIINFNNEIDNYINLYPDKSNVLSRIKDEINFIDRKLNKKCSLVFLAEKGAGKTTIIDYLLDLNYEKEKINEKTGKKIKVMEEVLETGSGATTLSEVEIIQSDFYRSSIEIIPYPKEDTIELLDSFAKIHFGNFHKIDEFIEISLPTELNRGCRNLTNLKENKKEKTDAASILASKYSVDNFKEFRTDVLRRANLENRNKLIYNYDGNINEKEWIKKIFRKINLVHLSESPIPMKIIIKLNKDIFDFSTLKRIDRIIDTRGLEAHSITDRLDIKNLFRKKDDNSLIVLVDKFNSPSKSIIDLIDHYIYDKNLDILDRTSYIVNFRDGEAENVLCSDGKAENIEIGISEKLAQLKQIFNENKLNFNLSNIIYANPRMFLKDDGRISIDDDDYDLYGDSRQEIIIAKKDIRNKHKFNFNKKLLQIINNYDNKLIEERKTLLEKYMQIKKLIDENTKLNLDNIKIKVIEKEFDLHLEPLVNDMYFNYIKNKFPSTLRAINNRFGIFNSNDIYCEGANFIEKNIKLKLKKFKDEIILDLKSIKNTNTVNQSQKNIIDMLIRDINNNFFNHIDMINTYYYEDLKNNTFSTNKEFFWTKVKRRWGMGAGYREDVNKYYKEHLIVNQVSEGVNTSIKTHIASFKVSLIELLDRAVE
ncbi:hypothetical protein [Clostridium sp.]|uniref:hypothetical protein n=1 Tax=Clostridium sp. TaxID=1506 RepID=UPI00399491CF